MSILTSNTQAKDNHSTKIDNSKSYTTQTFEKASIDSSNNASKKENKIFGAIFRLLEVKSFAKYLETKTKGKRHLQILLAGSPDKKRKYYWIKVGEDNGYSFVTNYNFYVYDNPIRIFYLDTTNDDKVISLKKWRQKNGM